MKISCQLTQLVGYIPSRKDRYITETRQSKPAYISVIQFTIGIHNWLQVLVLGDDIGYLTNSQISVFVLLDNGNKRREAMLVY